MRTALALIAALLAVALGVSTASATGPRAGSGDANCDGTANSFDALLVLRVAAGIADYASLPCPAAANVHIDPTIDSRDAQPILRYDAGLLDALPPIPDTVLDAVFEATADLLNVSSDDVVVIEREARLWPDSCLGLGEPDEGCLLAIAHGWRVTVRAAGRAVIWHVDSFGHTRLDRVL